MSSDTKSANEPSDNKKGILTLETIIRRPKFTATEEMRKAVNAFYTRQLSSYTVFLKNILPLKNRTIRIDNEKKRDFNR